MFAAEKKLQNRGITLRELCELQIANEQNVIEIAEEKNIC